MQLVVSGVIRWVVRAGDRKEEAVLRVWSGATLRTGTRLEGLWLGRLGGGGAGRTGLHMSARLSSVAVQRTLHADTKCSAAIGGDGWTLSLIQYTY